MNKDFYVRTFDLSLNGTFKRYDGTFKLKLELKKKLAIIPFKQKMITI